MIKTVIVKGIGWIEEITVDTALFDDIYVEACTQALENKKQENNLNIAAVLQASLKSNGKTKEYTLNSYKILNNASLFKEAENLRLSCIKQYGVDFRLDKIRSK